MKDIKITCPLCGHIISLLIQQNGELAVCSDDICADSANMEVLRLCGYEFGMIKAEGGEKSDE